MRQLLCVVLLVGCGDDGGTPIDAPNKLIDAPAPPAGHHYYVIDKVTLPASNTQAREFAFDLDGDAAPDNQLGMVFSTFAGMGISAQPAVTNAIDFGTSIMLADLFADDFATAPAATFTLYQGADPMPAACANAQDTVCRHHLAGTASFSIKPGAPVDAPLQGAFATAVFTGGPGHLTISLSFGGATPATITLLAAHAKLATVTATAIGNAVIGGAISQSDIDGKVIPAMRDGIMATVMTDCTMLTSPPGCGCAQNSSGKTMIGLYDTNHDCDISVDEVRNNSLIQSLLAPDVMVEGTRALSFGFGATAVPAGFVAP